MDITNIKGISTLKILVKPNSKENKIIAYDKERELYKVNIKAPAESGKANLEIIKFFSKLTKKKVSIISGLSSKRKILKFL
ncbi:MAG: YggU family protein [Candidatus Woesearchaeota archaeon]|nr:MAG: YggU family protein [Candidatus Woesearchaeota archaeon]